MAEKKRAPQVRYLATEAYLMTRGAALHFPAKQFHEMLTDDNSVYGLVIDMPINPTTLATLVVYINGAANLYFNNFNGTNVGAYTGASQRYQTVVQAGRLLVANSSRILEEAEKTKRFDLPLGPTNQIYLLTKGGIYKKSVVPAEITSESKEMQAVYFLYQQVMRELHSAQLKDRAALRSQNK